MFNQKPSPVVMAFDNEAAREIAEAAEDQLGVVQQAAAE
jgi:hypothetical protein